MTTKTQLQKKVQELETELQEFKSQLSSYQEITIETASVGDVLEDGSIVLKKENGLALLVAPKSTEVKCPWSKGFPEVFQKLREQDFNPSRWFVPTKEQLQLAYQNIPDGWTFKYYWSSTEDDVCHAWAMGFFSGIPYTMNKIGSGCVRAFRCVTY